MMLQNLVPCSLLMHTEIISPIGRITSISNRLLNAYELILTHQITESIDGMYNFGGFTDGDRAVCLAIGLGVPKSISLIGFSTTKLADGRSKLTRLENSKNAWMYVLQMIGWMSKLILAFPNALRRSLIV